MTGLTNLFLPLEDPDFLVPGERVFYRRRRHWAVLLYPAFEMVAVFFLATWILVDVPEIRRSLPVALLVLGALVLTGRWVLRVNWRNWRTRGLTLLIILIIASAGIRVPALAVLIVLAFTLRLLLHWVKWRWYIRLLVTDRRVIEVDGFLGSRVATLPLGRITDAVLKHSPLGELLDYGEFRVESAGQDQGLGRINFLEGAERFQSIVIQLAARANPDLPFERDQAYPVQYYDPGMQ